MGSSSTAPWVSAAMPRRCSSGDLGRGSSGSIAIPRRWPRRAERLRRFGSRVRLVEARFGELAATLGEERIDGGIYADLGVSSLQLDRGERGFSFQRRARWTCGWGGRGRRRRRWWRATRKRSCGGSSRNYGEERMARRIARAVVAARSEAPIDTTERLRQVVHRAKGRAREAGIDAATRAFQALRIEVNDELGELRTLLDQAIRLLEQDGRLVDPLVPQPRGPHRQARAAAVGRRGARPGDRAAASGDPAAGAAHPQGGAAERGRGGVQPAVALGAVAGGAATLSGGARSGRDRDDDGRNRETTERTGRNGALTARRRSTR